jgi:hypothetical protein
VPAVRQLGAALAAVALLGACTSGGGADPTPTPSVRTQTVTHTTTPTPGPSAPVSTGPTVAATASDCPFLRQQAAANRVGMRLERITVLRSGGKIVGCRFYALQNSPLAESEHLPGPDQPAIEIKTVLYPSMIAAHNAFVTLGSKGANVQQDAIVGQAPGLCFQTDFYAKDKGKDWACAFNLGRRMVLVRTVVTSSEVSAISVSRAVAKGL